ncbi:MAG: ATP-binding cassette domain-containing protein [Lachnospiraceae bacterium]|nr:ATP-binding cassette domain-containing protein [Lachnospiraceae bacterium]
MKDIAIKVENVKVRYRTVQKRSIKKNLFKLKKSDVEYFEALHGISFELEKGKVLGIVGKNGSGKSTLLKTIAGIFAPDEGTIDLFGNSVSILAIGTGFQKKLTGRENIMLSGILMGFSEEEVKKKMKEIIDFSELKEFIDKPVRTYSSGMYSKLAFSIAAILNTDIMLIDEVLSVGDAKFKKKSYKKVRELIKDENRTVVIVSHSSETVSKLCDTVLWIHEGDLRMIGPTDEVMPLYDEFMS